jgi:hypothetical protein
MSDVLDNIYLPNFEKRKIRESEPYQLLKENNIDPSSLEGYRHSIKFGNSSC